MAFHRGAASCAVASASRSLIARGVKRGRRTAILMSGGVDSSVAAYLLQQQQEDDLVGVHMSNWNVKDESSSGQYCLQSEKDADDAQAVCDCLDIRLRRVSFASDYWTRVFEPFIANLAEGITPNPDVGCNAFIKFGAMKDFARTNLRADSFATGHYARLWHTNHDSLFSSSHHISDIVKQNIADLPEEEWLANASTSASTTPLLLTGADLSKDQSYFLCGVPGNAFTNVVFPLGDFIKSSTSATTITVRDIAIRANLPTANKRESMGICFIGKRRNFHNFISEYLPLTPVPGNFVDVDTGEVVGRHDGSAYYTIGQGARISGATQKWFIAAKTDNNAVFVCKGTSHPALYSNELTIRSSDFNWIGGELPPPLLRGKSIRGLCRTRHLHPLVPCEVFWSDSSFHMIVVLFDQPVRAITPGQVAAIYVGRTGILCLGGGPVWKRGPTYHELDIDLPLPNVHPAGHHDLLMMERRECNAVGVD